MTSLGHEAALRAAVARTAGLPAEALQPLPALSRERYRLVSGVDKATAEALANEARGLGLPAQVHAEREPEGLSGVLASRWYVVTGLLWVLFPGLMAAGAPDATFWLMVALTVGLTSLVAPWAAKPLMPPSVRELPIAYRSDLRAALTPPYLARALAPPSSALAPAAAALAPPATTPATTPPTTRVGRLAAQATAALAALDASLKQQHARDLPEPVAADLRSALRDLRHEVEDISEDASHLESALAAAAPPTEGAWAAERLARLDTLARAGTPVDTVERQRLAAAVAATEAAAATEATLDSRLNADLARLLEIATAARRMDRELSLEQDAARPPERALDDLRSRAKAAASARRELAGRG